MRLVGVGVILLGIGLIAYALRMSDGAYAAALKQCARLPDKYTPEIGWWTTLLPASIAILGGVVAVFSASRSRGTTIGALIFGGLGLLAALACVVGMLNAPCPPLT